MQGGRRTDRPSDRQAAVTSCFLVSDLHGRKEAYQALFRAISGERPRLVFMGGDLLPAALSLSLYGPEDFVCGFMREKLGRLREVLAESFPSICLILGNDDVRAAEPAMLDLERDGLVQYIHNRKTLLGGYWIYGYACVPPSPFLLKDWERYDVSRFTDPGCIPPEEGEFTFPVDRDEVARSTISNELSLLTRDATLDRAVFLFHAPPYLTALDRADLDRVKVDGVPLDVHVGSIAIRDLIESRQPMLTMHGHAHESAKLTGNWRDRIGRTHLFSAAHDGPELALIRFDLEALDQATRRLMPVQN